MALPKISVVTLSYNQGKFLEETIKSVLDQQYPNLEYIIMDGGSTDNSVDIIKKYEKHLTYWQSQPDDGQSAAINAGFAIATGDIFCWLNSDDQFTPGSLIKVGNYFSQNPKCKWLAGHGIAIMPNNKEIYFKAEINHKYRLCDFWMWCREGGCYMSQPSVFWTRQLWDQSGGYCREDKPNSMDYELWLRFNQYAYPQIIQETLSVAKLHGECKSIINRLSQRKELLESAKEHCDNVFFLQFHFLFDWEKLNLTNLFKSICKCDLKNIFKYCTFLIIAPFFSWNDVFCFFMLERFRKYELLYRPD